MNALIAKSDVGSILSATWAKRAGGNRASGGELLAEAPRSHTDGDIEADGDTGGAR